MRPDLTRQVKEKGGTFYAHPYACLLRSKFCYFQSGLQLQSWMASKLKLFLLYSELYSLIR